MNRSEIRQHNQAIIALVRLWHKSRHETRYHFSRRLNIRRPKLGYKEMAEKLNSQDIYSSRGNPWTFRSLYRMMQRQGVRLIDISY